MNYFLCQMGEHSISVHAATEMDLVPYVFMLKDYPFQDHYLWRGKVL